MTLCAAEELIRKQEDQIRARMLALGVEIPTDQPARLHFARISFRQHEDRLRLAIDEFVLALAKAGGNQVHLAERSLESPRLIRHQVRRARDLGIDVDQRVKVVMGELGIVPWVQPPPPRRGQFGPPVAARPKKNKITPKKKKKPKRKVSVRRPV